MLGMLSRQAVLASLLAGVVVAAPPETPREVNRELNRERQNAQPRPGAPVVEQRGAIQIQPGAQQPGVQQPGVVVETRREGAQVARNNARELDQHVVDCLMLGNQEEINLGQFASERASDPRVKEFAQMLIRDHSALNQKLQSFSSQRPQAQTTIPAGSATVQTQQVQPQVLPTDTPADRREARQELRQQGQAPRDAREAVRDAAQAGANIIAGAEATAPRRMEVTTGYRGEADTLNDQLYQIAREAKRNCGEMTKEELSKESGHKFDQAFLGCQIASHIGMLAELKAVHGHVSPELQQVLSEATQSVKQHKAHADQLMKELSQDNRTSN